VVNRNKPGSKPCWEAVTGQARAIKYGNTLYVSGTTAADAAGSIIGIDDAYAQAAYALDKIKRAVQHAGGCVEDVIRTRVYLTNPDHWHEIIRAHRERFPAVDTADILVVVKSAIADNCLVEIEADAVISQRN
jgi:enamine deaminase RidA (YjgF/YER057c/UK114 family)